VVTVKERLTGAIILVALIVLLVPELLTGPIRTAPRAASLPLAAGEAPLRSYTINLADDAHSRATAPQPSGPEQPAALPSATPQSTAAAAAQSPPERSTPQTSAPLAPAPPALSAPTPARGAAASGAAPAPTTAAPATGDAGAWMVQLGSFASRANAEHLARQLRAQGFPVSVSQGSSGRRLYRVRVGPANDRTAATQLAQKLRALGHNGSIVPK
jgi:DedD protein